MKKLLLSALLAAPAAVLCNEECAPEACAQCPVENAIAHVASQIKAHAQNDAEAIALVEEAKNNALNQVAGNEEAEAAVVKFFNDVAAYLELEMNAPVEDAVEEAPALEIPSSEA